MPNGPQAPLTIRDKPLWMKVRDVAKSLSVPPWTLEHPDRPPTEDEVSLWYERERFLLKRGL